MLSSSNPSERNWNFIKGVFRVSTRCVIDSVHRLVINVFDTLFGFLLWPQKKLRIRIAILRTPQGDPVVLPSVLDAAIEYAKRSFRKNFNVKLLPLNGQFVEVLETVPPHEALYTKGGTGALGEEFNVTGGFFASNLSGLFYPVTAFVVIDIVGATGCSLGPISDYVTLDANGARSSSILAHELAHACGLWHVGGRSNLLWRYKDRGDEVSWWQKNLFRGSRHITYW